MPSDLPFSSVSTMSLNPNGTHCQKYNNLIPSLVPPPNEHGEPYPIHVTMIAMTNPGDTSNDGGLSATVGRKSISFKQWAILTGDTQYVARYERLIL